MAINIYKDKLKNKPSNEYVSNLSRVGRQIGKYIK